MVLINFIEPIQWGLCLGPHIWLGMDKQPKKASETVQGEVSNNMATMFACGGVEQRGLVWRLKIFLW